MTSFSASYYLLTSYLLTSIHPAAPLNRSNSSRVTSMALLAVPQAGYTVVNRFRLSSR